MSTITYDVATIINCLYLDIQVYMSVGWLCFTSHRQLGHLETAPQFTVPCEGREARFLHRSHWESNPGPSRGSPLHYRCTTPAPLYMSEWYSSIKTYFSAHVSACTCFGHYFCWPLQESISDEGSFLEWLFKVFLN